MKATTLQPHPVSLNAIMSYRHDGLVERLEDKMNLTHQAAEELFEDLKRFLYLCASTDEPLAPSEMIDEAWHNFILFTKDYGTFCKRYAGRFIHHFPKTRAQKLTNDGTIIRRTLLAATTAFGQSLSGFWNYQKGGTECDECSGSTNCQNSD